MDKRRNYNNTDTDKQCADCKRVLPHSEFFGKSTPGGRSLIPYCKACFAIRNAELYQRNKQRIADRRRALKQECVDILGGKCARCGYHEFASGLDFHHLGDKDDLVSVILTSAARGNGKQRALLMNEVSKCTLLCRNCHSAYHAGEWS